MTTENIKRYKQRFFVEKTFSFDAAHVLPELVQHKCSNFHGHTYSVTIGLEASELNKDGFVIDFNELAPIKQELDQKFDHATIISENDEHAIKFFKSRDSKVFLIPGNYPQATSEVIALVILDTIVEHFINERDLNIIRVRVKVSETPTSSATVERRFVDVYSK